MARPSDSCTARGAECERRWPMGYRGSRKARRVTRCCAGTGEDFHVVVGDIAPAAAGEIVLLSTDTQLPRVRARMIGRGASDQFIPARREAQGVPRSDPAVPHGGTPSTNSRATSGLRGAIRPTLYRAVRMLPGQCPRRLVHRQGQLRRRGLRARAHRAVPRKPHLSTTCGGCHARAGMC